MERRSLPHITRLSKDSFPADSPHDGALAIRILINILRHAKLPTPSDPEEELAIIRVTTKMVLKPFLTCMNWRWEEKIPPPAHVREYEGNMDMIVGWLHFIHHESHWLFASWGLPKSRTDGPMIAAQSLSCFYRLGGDQLREEMDLNPRVIDLLLDLWSWKNHLVKTLQYQLLARGEADICPVLSTLWSMVQDMDSPPCAYLLEKIRTLSSKQYLRFIGYALARIEEWEHLRCEPTVPSVRALAQLIRLFVSVPAHAKPYIRSGYGPKMLSASKSFAHLRCHGRHGKELMPLPMAISTYLVPWEGDPPPLLFKGIPGLLDAGLLEVLVNRIISYSGGQESPWGPWVGNDSSHEAAGPIQAVLSMCTYRPILAAVSGALSRIPREKREHERFRDYWNHFYKPSLSLYEEIWSHEEASGGVDGTLQLCDNSDVSHPLPLLLPTRVSFFF